MLNKIIVNEIKEIPQCDVGAPSPIITSNENVLHLFYYTHQPNPNFSGKSIHVRNENDKGIACITFENYAQYKAGNPNDETANGHPLYQYGLRPYSFNEVLGSPWIQELKKINSVHPGHSDKLFDKYKHFIYFFHDSCFEIISSQYSYEIYKEKPMQDVIAMKIIAL